MHDSIATLVKTEIVNPIIIKEIDSRAIKIAKMSINETNNNNTKTPKAIKTGNSITLNLLFFIKLSESFRDKIEKIKIHNFIK